MKFKSTLLVLLGLCMFSTVQADRFDGKDVVLPEFSLKFLISLITDAFELYQRLRHRQYKRLMPEREEPGPLKYHGEKFVQLDIDSNIIKD